jgi:hypothetical protein
MCLAFITQFASSAEDIKRNPGRAAEISQNTFASIRSTAKQSSRVAENHRVDGHTFARVALVGSGYQHEHGSRREWHPRRAMWATSREVSPKQRRSARVADAHFAMEVFDQ